MGEFDAQGKSIVMLSNGKQGVIDTLGNTFIQPIYDKITRLNGMPGYFFAGNKSQLYGLANTDGELITPALYSKIEPRGELFTALFHDSTYLLSKDNSSTYIGKKTRAFGFENGVGFIRVRKGFQLINDRNEVVDETIYRMARAFNNGYAPVSNNGKWGLVNYSGQTILDLKFEDAKTFQFTAGVFKQNGKWRFITPEGKKLKSPRGAEAAFEIAPGMYVYQKGDKYAVCNAKGHYVSHFGLALPVFKDSNLIICKQNKIIFYNTEGKKTKILDAQKGMYEKQITQQMTLTGKNGIKNENYSLIFSSGQLQAFGAENAKDKFEIPLNISRIFRLQKTFLYEAYLHDIYLIIAHRNYQYRNGNGDLLFNQYFYSASPFENNRSIASLGPNQYGILDEYGFWLLPPVYQNIKKINSNTFMYKTSYTWQVIAPNASIINPKPLDNYEMDHGLLMMKCQNDIGYYDPAGRTVYALPAAKP